jgi:hypothetical protein
MTKYYKTKREDLFFEPQIRDLQTINGNKIIVIPEFKAIMNGGDCLGVRRKPVDAEECQYYEHEFAYEAAAKVAKEIDPDIFNSISYKNEDSSEVLIFFGSQEPQKEGIQLIKTSKLRVKRNSHEILAEHNYSPREFNYPLRFSANDIDISPKDDIYSLLCYGFQPTIAVKNEYTYDGRTIFYLLIEPAEKNTSPRSFLTVAKFTFIEDTLTNMQTKNREVVRALGNISCSIDCVYEFQKAIAVFVDTFDKLQEIEASPEILVAVALDIFNKNRSIQAILSDEKLKRNILHFVEKAEEFFYRKDNMSDLIHYIVRYHNFDFVQQETSDKEYKNILTEKRAYSNLKRLFTGKNQESEELHKYMKEQLETYQALRQMFPIQIKPWNDLVEK